MRLREIVYRAQDPSRERACPHRSQEGQVTTQLRGVTQYKPHEICVASSYPHLTNIYSPIIFWILVSYKLECTHDKSDYERNASSPTKPRLRNGTPWFHNASSRCSFRHNGYYQSRVFLLRKTSSYFRNNDGTFSKKVPYRPTFCFK